MIEERLKKIKDGEGSIEDYRALYFEFKRISELEKEFKKECQEYFDRFDKKELESFNIEKRQGRKTYDFKHISEWVKAKNNLSKIESKCKAALELDELDYIDQDSGEIIEREVPRVKYSKDVIIFKK